MSVQQHNTVNAGPDRMGWIIGGLGITVGAIACALIWTTRDMWQMQSAQVEWMRDRMALIERDNNALRDRIAILEAYESQRRK